MTDSRRLNALRVAFLVAVVLFAWYGLHGRLGEVGDALRATSLLGTTAAFGLVVVGLLATGLVWLRLVRAAGGHLAPSDGLAMFFLGQLGKYIPGSVWSIGAQAHLAGRKAVPRSTTVAAGLLFLGYHVASGVAASAAVVLLGGLAVPWPPWLTVLLLVVPTVGMTPVVVRWVGSRIARRRVSLTVSDVLVIVSLMAAAWAAYAVALVLLLPNLPWADIPALGAAFALAYAAGVVVVVAPAGVGAREPVFVVLLTPLLGVGGATALALLARAVHTAADGVVAAGWWYGARLRTQVASTTPATRSSQGCPK